MGLLDSVLGSLSQGGSGSGGNPLLETVLSMVNNPDTGGLAGLLQKLQENGLGNVADSWVSTGKNLPISPDQLQNALGSGELGSLAEKLGMSTGDVSSQLADLLPGVVDKLTPNGQVPDMGSLGDLLGSLTKRLG
ncbi:MAG: YidB family protein [Burkholderiales bacterium]|nr:DUF937 domain-containing protein [Burkholderiales bacterium]MBZ0249106.1 YidB family protein [Burkholderiales bacterium]MCL4687853.1 DUF937 domain-containing protein [Burkholderiales bacterium]